MWLFKSSFSAFFLAAMLLAPVLPAAQNESADPADALLSEQLSADEEKLCRELFAQLAHEDFDIRNGALAALVAKGPKIIKLAAEFAAHKDRDIAEAARGLPRKVVVDYEGYLPENPALARALRAPAGELPGGTLKEIGTHLAETHKLQLVADPALPLDEPGLLQKKDLLFRTAKTVGDVFDRITAVAGGVAVPRGEILLLTTAENARKFQHQRVRLNVTALELGRDDLERVTTGLARFFPSDNNELNATTEFLIVTGLPASLARAARLVELLKPRGADRIFPPLPPTQTPTAEVLAKLAAPATVSFNSENLLIGLEALRKDCGVAVLPFTGDTEAAPETALDMVPELKYFAPLRLVLRDAPLGFALQWVERRGRSPQEPELILGYEISAAGRIQLRPQYKTGRLQQLHVAGVDVRFLYPPGVASNAMSDAAAFQTLQPLLESHLALFPHFVSKRDMNVLRGRLLLQGHPATLAHALEIVAALRDKKEVPEPAWQRELKAKLDAPIEWDGTGMSGPRAFQALRKLSTISLLLEDGPDGTPANFKLPTKDAELLPPGTYPLRKLLEALAEKVNARWSADCGVIVLMPRPVQK